MPAWDRGAITEKSTRMWPAPSIRIIPILLIYPLVLKFYTKDAMAGGVKG